MKLVLLGNFPRVSTLVNSKSSENPCPQLFFAEELEKRLVAVADDPANATLKDLLQSPQIIQMIKSYYENLYESSLNACSQMAKMVENSDIISLVISISSEVRNMLYFQFLS